MYMGCIYLNHSTVRCLWLVTISSSLEAAFLTKHKLETLLGFTQILHIVDFNIVYNINMQ